MPRMFRVALAAVLALVCSASQAQPLRVEVMPGPATAAEHHLRAWAAEAAEDWDGAVEEYTEALRLNPRDAGAYHCRSQAWVRKGDIDRAAADEAEARRLGLVWGSREVEMNITTLTEAIRWNPENAVCYAERGRARIVKRDADGTPADYGARAWMRTGRPGEAVADFERSIEIAPNLSSARTELAWLLATTAEDGVRDGGKAVEHALVACELTGRKDSRALEALAAGYAETGRFREAVETQQEAVEAAPIAARYILRQALAAYQRQEPWREKWTH